MFPDHHQLQLFRKKVAAGAGDVSQQLESTLLFLQDKLFGS